MNNHNIDIIYFANNDKMASTRYRGKYVLEYLQLKKKINNYRIIYHKIKFYPLLLFYIVGMIFGIGKQKVWIFQKTATKSTYSFLLKILLKLAANTLYDIDDAVYMLRDEEIVNFFIKNARCVTVGSKHLQEYCLKWNNSSLLLTTPVPDASKLKECRQELFTIGWVGFYSVHKENMEKIVFPILKKLQFEFRLKLLGVQSSLQKQDIIECFKSNENIILDIPLSINWRDELDVNSRIVEFDLGIMPLINNEVNISKSAFKVKQYLSMGIPVLASPVGENKIFVDNGYNGYLCNTDAEWQERFTYFYKLNKAEYKQFTVNALNFYKSSNFRLDVVSEQYYSIFENFIHR